MKWVEATDVCYHLCMCLISKAVSLPLWTAWNPAADKKRIPRLECQGGPANARSLLHSVLRTAGQGASVSPVLQLTNLRLRKAKGLPNTLMSSNGSGVQNKVSGSQVRGLAPPALVKTAWTWEPMSHTLTTAPANRNISQCINSLHFNYYLIQGCHLVLRPVCICCSLLCMKTPHCLFWELKKIFSVFQV